MKHQLLASLAGPGSIPPCGGGIRSASAYIPRPAPLSLGGFQLSAFSFSF
jgi:hypothetical protein